MKKRRIFLSVAILFAFMVIFSTVNAVNIIDSKEAGEVYKSSEDDSAFDLPFIRVINDRTTLDTEISQLGMLIVNSSVDINATIKSSQLILANDTVRINSNMEDVVVLSSGSVIVNAEVDNIIVLAGQSVTIGEEGNVKENLIVATPSLKVSGNIDGNVLGSANSSVIDGNVKGQVRLETEEVEFGENSKVESGIYINTTDTTLSVPESVGNATIDIISNEEITESIGEKVKDYIFDLVLAIIRDLVVFAIIMLIFKKDNVKKLVSKVTPNSIIKNGLLTYVAAIGCIIFGFSLGLFILPQVGWSAVIVGVAIMIVFTLMKNVIVGTFVANLPKTRFENIENKPSNVMISIMSFILLELMETIPFVGGLVKFAVFIFALGIIVSMIVNKTEKVEADKEETETIIAE